MKGLGLGGLLAVVALVGCGSSGSSTGTGGNTGTGATGHAGSTGTAGNGSAGHAGGGGATGTGAPFSTSVPSGTKITGLTGAQATQFCKDVENYLDNTFIPALCNATAASSIDGLEAAYFDLLENSTVTDTQLRADCTAANADAGPCLFNNLDGGTDTCNVSSVPATCQATVGDYGKCLNDETAAASQYYASFPSCSTLTAASLNAFFAADGGLSGSPTEPTSCSQFDSTCDVDGGTSAMTNMSPLPTLRRKR